MVSLNRFEDCPKCWPGVYYVCPDHKEQMAREAAEAQESADYEPPTDEEREELDRLGSSNA